MAAVVLVPIDQIGAEPDDVADVIGTADGATVGAEADWPEFDVGEVRDVRRPGISGDGRWIVAEVELDDM